MVDYGIKAPAGNPEAERQVFLAAYPALREKRLLLFMSRLHPKKGLDLLIQAFGQVVERDPRLHLVVAGPDQEGLRAGLEARARTLGIAERITWASMLTGDARWGAYYAAEAFCLPSHSENFGMVVAEALARGLPVLISDKVNIWREIEADRAGFVAPDTLAGTVSLLKGWLQLSDTQRLEMGDRARACFAKRFEIRKAAEKLLSVIERSIGQSSSAPER
jgi:glycosyltransferase involved in cell wall biosynthesis